MTTAVKESDLIKAHGSPPPGMVFYNSLEAVRSDVNLLGYVSVIERAWNEMKIHGVLCLDTRPVLYLKESIEDRHAFLDIDLVEIIVSDRPTIPAPSNPEHHQ